MWCLLVSDSQHLADFSLRHTVIQRSSRGNIRSGIWRFVGWVLSWCLWLQSAFRSGHVSPESFPGDKRTSAVTVTMRCWWALLYVVSSLLPSSVLEMCKQHLDAVSPMLFKPQWWTKLSFSLWQHDSRWFWLWFLSASSIFAGASGEAAVGCSGCPVRLIIIRVTFFPGRTGFWTANLLHLIPWLLVSLLMLGGKSLYRYLQGLI